jgi:glycine cleavage system H protein
MAPEGLRYTEEHEWVRLEGSLAVVGITDYAQKKLGDIVFVELPEVGKSLKPGDTLGTIESVKAASEIYCPVSGAVTEVNEELADSPGNINKDPYGDGWIAKLGGVGRAEFDRLMDAATYEELTAGEEDK